MDAEELYLKNYTRYGDIAYDDDENESEEEFDTLASGEMQWEWENGR